MMCWHVWGSDRAVGALGKTETFEVDVRAAIHIWRGGVTWPTKTRVWCFRAPWLPVLYSEREGRHTRVIFRLWGWRLFTRPRAKPATVTVAQGAKLLLDDGAGQFAPWNELSVDPVRDIQQFKATMTEGGEYLPQTMIIGPRTYVELLISKLNFGWWPMRVWRQQGARQALLAHIEGGGPAESEED